MVSKQDVIENVINKIEPLFEQGYVINIIDENHIIYNPNFIIEDSSILVGDKNYENIRYILFDKEEDLEASLDVYVDELNEFIEIIKIERINILNMFKI